MAYRAIKFHTLPQPELRDQSQEELINVISMYVRWAQQNLDETAGSILAIMELRKKYPDDIPEFGSIPGAWKNLDEARRAIDVLRYKIVHKK